MSIENQNSSGVVYRGMDRATLDAAYNNTAAVADSLEHLDRWARLSEMTRSRDNATLDLRYGNGPRACLDYFSADDRSAPSFVFIHGGYWQRNSKNIFAFLADGPLGKRINVATIGYTLAPDASLTEIVNEVRAALDFLSARAGELGFDREAIFTGGWSAGGHLASITSDHPSVRGVLSISGIFDLEPISLNYLNDALQLKASEIQTLSPVHRLSNTLPPCSLVVGADELPELQRQSSMYLQARQALDLQTTFNRLAGHNHYSILGELMSSEGHITAELVKLIDRTAACLR